MSFFPIRTLFRLGTPLVLTVGLVACGSQTSAVDPLDDDGLVALPDSETPWCDTYLACLSETDPLTMAAVLDAYGPEGSCWGTDTDALCEQSCQRGLADARADYPELPPTCLAGASVDEILEVADRICPGSVVPYETDIDQAECIAQVVVECSNDVQAAIEDCMYVPPPPPEPRYRTGTWRVEVGAVQLEECGPWPSVRRFAISGDGFSYAQATKLDGNPGEVGDCPGAQLDCMFSEGPPSEYLWLTGTFDSLEHFHGSMITGDLGGTCGQIAEIEGFWESN